MKITRQEWEVLSKLLNREAQKSNVSGKRRTGTETIAENLLQRFKMELTFPKGFKP